MTRFTCYQVPSCASIQTSCSAKLGSLSKLYPLSLRLERYLLTNIAVSKDALADCVKQVNPSCPAQSQPPTKRDGKSHECNIYSLKLC